MLRPDASTVKKNVAVRVTPQLPAAQDGTAEHPEDAEGKPRVGQDNRMDRIILKILLILSDISLRSPCSLR